MMIQRFFYVPAGSWRLRFTNRFVGALLTSLIFAGLLSGCESLHGHLRSSLVGVWLGANGALGEYHTLTLASNGDFSWAFRDEPLKVEDTYRGEWRVRTVAVQLLFTGGESKTGEAVRPPHPSLALSILATGQGIVLTNEAGMRFERARAREQHNQQILGR